MFVRNCFDCNFLPFLNFYSNSFKYCNIFSISEHCDGGSKIYLPRLEKRLPNRAPNKDKLAIHEPCCSVIVRCGKCGENDGILLSLWLSFWGNKDAKAGDV